MNDVLLLILLTVAPFLELRAGIPYGIFSTELSLFWVMFIAIAANIALAPVLFLLLHYVVHLFRRVESFDKLWTKIVERAQRKVRGAVEKYGVIGLALFIGVPLPGSGVYTAALGAYALGFSFRNFFIASVFGVIIAAAAVMAISLFGKGALLWFIRVS